MVMVFFSSKISTVSIVRTGNGFLLTCMHFVHVALLDHSMPNNLQQGCNDETEHSPHSIAFC